MFQNPPPGVELVPAISMIDLKHNFELHLLRLAKSSHPMVIPVWNDHSQIMLGILMNLPMARKPHDEGGIGVDDETLLDQALELMEKNPWRSDPLMPFDVWTLWPETAESMVIEMVTKQYTSDNNTHDFEHFMLLRLPNFGLAAVMDVFPQALGAEIAKAGRPSAA